MVEHHLKDSVELKIRYNATNSDMRYDVICVSGMSH